MRRFFIRGLLSLYLTVGFALPAPAQSLLDAQWMAEATRLSNVDILPALKGH